MAYMTFVERIEYQMGIEPEPGHSLSEVVDRLNQGRYEIVSHKGIVMESQTSTVVAAIFSVEATATGVERGEFASVPE